MSNRKNRKTRFLFWLSRKINYPLLPPEVIQISLTYRCNIKCRMCGLTNLFPQEEELELSQIMRIIDQASIYGVDQVVFTGGEPFLRKDLFKICEYCHSKGMLSVITTNGTLIDMAVAEKISRAKVDHIHISLDGLEETNDFYRGKGVFRQIVEAIEILNEEREKRHRFSLGIAFTVMEKNVQDMHEVLKLSDRLRVDVINFQPLVNNNANFLDRRQSQFWVNGKAVVLLEEEIRKIRGYKRENITVQEEPRLELLVKYYKMSLDSRDWVCFGGFKTAFVCFSKKQPLLYSCHGICGNLDGISLKKAWVSREAYRLRLHSGSCRDFCLQSCYSKQSCQSLSNLISS